MPWVRAALAERCGSCRAPIAAQALAWAWSVPGGPRRLRCRECAESMLGFCELYEPELGVEAVAPQPGLFASDGWTAAGQLVVTPEQLLARNQSRAVAIERARERRRR